MPEETDMDLNEEEDIRIEDSREKHWAYFAEDGEYKSNIHAMRWNVYTREKEELIERECVWCQLRIRKGGNCLHLCEG